MEVDGAVLAGSLAPIGLVAREVVPGDGAGRHVRRRAVAVVAGDVGDAVGRHVEAEVPCADEVGAERRRARRVTSARAVSASSSRARPISRGRSSRPSKWRVAPVAVDRRGEHQRRRRRPAIGPPPDASRCVTSSCPAPGSRQGMWLTDARPASTVSATKHQPQRGSAIPVATRTWAPPRPTTASSVPSAETTSAQPSPPNGSPRLAMTCSRPPGAVGWTKTANVKSRAERARRHRHRRERAARQVLVAPRPRPVDRRRHEDLLEARSGRVRVAVDEPHEPALVPVVIRADHEPDRVARCGAQAVRVAEQAEHRVGRVRRVGSGRRRPRTPPRTRARARCRATDGSRAG